MILILVVDNSSFLAPFGLSKLRYDGRMAQRKSPLQVQAVENKVKETYEAGNITGDQYAEMLSNVSKIATDIADHDGFSSLDEETYDILSEITWESWLFTHQEQY